MDFLENNRPKPEDVMPFIKLSAIMGTPPPESMAASKMDSPEEDAAEWEADQPEEEEMPAATAPVEQIVPRQPLPKLDGASVRNMLNRTPAAR
jgi:hypothetical protein